MQWKIIQQLKGMKYIPWKQFAKYEKSDTKGHIEYNSIYMKCPKIDKSIETECRFLAAGWQG